MPPKDRNKKAPKKSDKKIFVLDTSVILYDHHSFMKFGIHDVAIPIIVLEELDNFKKGNDVKNLAAREFIRTVDKLSLHNTLDQWIQLPGTANVRGKFKIVMNDKVKNVDAQKVFGGDKADHSILNVALSLAEIHPTRRVVLVSKDINLRLKAKSLKIMAEDFEAGQIEETETFYTGRTVLNDLSSELISKFYEEKTLAPQAINLKNPISNHYYTLKNGKSSALSYYNPNSQMVERVEKKIASGIKPLNAEQVFALNAIMNPAIRLVTIQGVAGTGKTLLALAGAIEQKSEYTQIYLARPTVPLSNKDIGYLPGNAKDKTDPYMAPLWDNLAFIKNQYPEKSRERKNIDELVTSEKLLISPLAYIRGRSFSKIFFIIDEAQNLTPHEVKTIITRAGKDTKIVFTGDIFQIDTPYLDTYGNGLSHIIDKMKGEILCAHITLEKGERSDLADLANKLL